MKIKTKKTYTIKLKENEAKELIDFLFDTHDITPLPESVFDLYISLRQLSESR